MLAKQKSAHRLLSLVFLFGLFRKEPLSPETPPTDELDPTILLDGDDSSYSRIRCPLCRWQPDSSSLWYCGGDGPPEYFKGCGTEWNTFDTHGQCPGCGHQWRWTACLWCENYSLHEAWYTNEED